jgi:hypothetical protein
MIPLLAIGSLFLAAASEGQDDALKRAWFMNDYGTFAELVFRKSPEEIAKIEAWLTRGRSEAIDNQEKRTMYRLHRFLVEICVERKLLELVAAKSLATELGRDTRYFSAPITERDGLSVFYLSRALYRVSERFSAALQADVQEQSGIRVTFDIIPVHFEKKERMEARVDISSWPDELAFGPPVEDFFVAHNITVHD